MAGYCTNRHPPSSGALFEIMVLHLSFFYMRVASLSGFGGIIAVIDSGMGSSARVTMGAQRMVVTNSIN
jgi:hypothetical protein